MHKSNLIQIIRTFSPKEIREFEKVVNSSLYNKNKNVIKLFEYIKKYYPECESKNLEKERAYKKLFSNKSYNENTMRSHMFKLSKLAEDYLAFINYTSFDFNVKKHLMLELNKRNLDNLFEKNIKSANEYINKAMGIEEDFFHHKCFIEIEYSNYCLDRNSPQEAVENYLNEAELQICYFMAVTKRIMNNLSICSHMFNTSYKFNIIENFFNNLNFEKFIKETRKHNSAYSGVLELYYYSYKTFINMDDEDSYAKCKKLLFENFHLMSKTEQYSSFVNLINCCNDRFKISRQRYLKEYFEILKFMLSNKLHKAEAESYISLLMYEAILSSAIALGETDWAEDFALEYIEEVHPDQRENLKNYALAQLYFAKGNYDYALANYQKINQEVFVLKLNVKVLLLKIYYEISEFDSAFSLIDSFRHFLSNNKNISERNNITYSNFLKFIKEMIKLKMIPNKESLELLKKNLVNTELVTNKEWILKKVKELDAL